MKQVLLFVLYPNLKAAFEAELQKKGVELVVVTDEEEAARLIVENRYVGIISSLRGNKSTHAGFNLLRILRIYEKGTNTTPATPFVLWSARVLEDGDAAALVQRGGVFVTKTGTAAERDEILKHLGL